MSALGNPLASIALCLLAACTTLPPLSDGITLSVRAYDPATGDYILELRNQTSRPVLYLNPYLTFDTVRSPDPEPFPASPEGRVLMVHNTRLAAGQSAVLTGTCTTGGACSRPDTYVAVRACWFTKHWQCEQYAPIWSGTTLNGGALANAP